jgi:branched-chain amino acid transport system permease protein
MATTADTVGVSPLEKGGARWRPTARGWSARIAVMAGLLGLLIYATAAVPDFWADRIALAAIYAIIGLSLNMVLGYTGQVSLGHHAFVGLAAFTSAYYVSEKAGCNPDVGCEVASVGAFSIGVLLAILSGVISAGILGLVALRIKGLYLSLITLTYGFVAINSMFEVSFLTRGGAGMPAARPTGFTGDHAFAFLCLALVGVVLFVDWRFLATKAGRAVLAIKESESVAATYAVNVTLYKIMAFMMSGAFAGLAGALFAHRRGIVVAVDFTFSIALLWVLMVVVGGLGNRTGVVIGSAFFALFPFLAGLIGPLEHFVNNTLDRDLEEFTLIVGPLLALVTIISFPGGIAEQISPITRWLKGERFSLHPEGKPEHHGRPNPLHKLGIGRKKETSEARATVPPSGAPTHAPEHPEEERADETAATGPLERVPPPPPAEGTGRPSDGKSDTSVATATTQVLPGKGIKARFSGIRIKARNRRADSNDANWPDVLKPQSSSREGSDE